MGWLPYAVPQMRQEEVWGCRGRFKFGNQSEEGDREQGGAVEGQETEILCSGG